MQVDAIFTSDLHLREDRPICRTDDYQAAQWSKVQQIFDLQIRYNCPVLHAGDLFNHWKPSPYLLSKAIKNMPYDFHTVFGNHDLPNHNINDLDKSGVYTLHTAECLGVLSCLHWEQTNTEYASYTINDRKILVWHVMTYQGDLPWPGCVDLSAKQILRKLHGQFDVIVTGHNHKSFVEEHNGSVLVNPGSMMRMKADEQDHKPSVYLWDSTTNEVKRHYLRIEENVISRNHIKAKKKEVDEVFLSEEAWSGSLNEMSISFKQNMEQRLGSDNNIRKPVKTIIEESLD